MLRRAIVSNLVLLCFFAWICVAMPQTVTGSAAKASAAPVTINEQNDGKDVDLSTGDTLLVKLQSNPTTGYGWTVVGDPTPLRLVKTTYVRNPQSSKAVGAPGVQVLRFTATAAGVTNLTLVYRRSWEYNVAPAKTFTARVRVR